MNQRVGLIHNKLFDSNGYVINITPSKVIIVDPGNPDTIDLKTWLSENNKTVIAVFLTHEHADHCAGVTELHKIQPFQLFCSQACATNIGNCKQNFSFYIESISPFEIKIPARIVNDGAKIDLEGTDFTFIATPGHSPGSVCIFTNDTVFTGDTLLNNTKTPLTFPHSNRKDYANSIQKIKTLLNPGMTIYPGHGEPFEVGKPFLQQFGI